MAITAGQRIGSRAVLAAFIFLFCAAAVRQTLTGSTLVALAVLMVVPFGFYVALVRPLTFPFGLYVLLVPFDNLLGSGTFGTLTKLLGIVAGAFLLLWTVQNHAANRASRLRAAEAVDQRVPTPTMNGVCRKTACQNGAIAAPVELYPGPGEYCPECGERLDPLRAPIVRVPPIAFKTSARSLMLLFALVAWMLMSALWALDQQTPMQALPTYAGLIILYAVLTMVPISTAAFRMLLSLIVVGGLAAAAYGAQAFYHDPALAQSGATARLVVHAGSTSIDPNHFANALLLPLAIITMWALRSRRIAARLAGICGLSLLTVAILLSESREALAGVLLIFVYYLLRSRYRLQLVIAAAAIAVVATTMQTSVWARFATILATGGSGRTSIWAVALEAAKHRPVHGYGIGNFQQAYDLYYIGVHQTYPFGWSSPAHSLVLHYLVELGFVGLALIALFFLSEFRSLGHIEKSSELYDYRIAMEGSLLAIAFVSLTIDLFTYKYAWLVFFMIALMRNASIGLHTKAEIRSANSAMIAARLARP
jgi:O-antigen ligase